MKAIIADLHAGNHKSIAGEEVDGIGEWYRYLLQNVRAVARLPKVDTVFVAGDVFDVWNPPPHVVAALMREVYHAPPNVSPRRWYGARGNHDMRSDMAHDNSMGGLAWMDLFVPVEVPLLVDTVWVVPFGHDALALTPPDGASFVVAHHGIWSDATAPYLRGTRHARSAADVEAWCKAHGVAGYFAGDWHRRHVHKEKDPAIVQIGALCPVSFSDAGSYRYGTVILLDEVTAEYTVLELPGPRFVVEELSSSLPAMPKGCDGFARVRKHDTDLDLTKLGYKKVEVLETVDDAATARVALDSTRSEAVQEAYHLWVNAEPSIPEEHRERVFKRGVELLQRASESE